MGAPPPPLPDRPRLIRSPSRNGCCGSGCLVDGCLGGTSNRSNLQVHFSHRHVRDTALILEKGNWPYPQFPSYDTFASHKSLNGRHLVTDFFRRREKQKWRRLAEGGARVWKATEITAYGIPLTPLAPFASFKYLEHVLSAS